MGYSFIILVASLALVAYFDFASEASVRSKTLVSVLFALGIAGFFWTRAWSLPALFLLAGVGVSILLYRVCQQARISGR